MSKPISFLSFNSPSFLEREERRGDFLILLFLFFSSSGRNRKRGLRKEDYKRVMIILF